MNISKYAAFFHDGTLLNIKHKGSNIDLFMRSSEMSEEDLLDSLPLSKDDRIQGILHLELVNIIEVKGTEMPRPLAIPFDSGSIFDFEIKENKINLDISWWGFPPKPIINEFSSITIEAEKIWWENIPDLYDPSRNPQNKPIVS